LVFGIIINYTSYEYPKKYPSLGLNNPGRIYRTIKAIFKYLLLLGGKE